MANVLVQAQLKGMTQEMYEANRDYGFFKKLENYDGYEGFHAGSPISGGWQVVELWESEAKHKAWVKNFVLPKMTEQGFNMQNIDLKVTYFPVHTSILSRVPVAH